MELRHIYKLSDIINESILENKIPKEILKDTVINVKVSPTTLYGIDKEFYRLTHDNSDFIYILYDCISCNESPIPSSLFFDFIVHRANLAITDYFTEKDYLFNFI